MTYCVGLLLREGLVCLADSRTNAGVDYISTFRKLTVWSKPGNRMISLMTAGNLSISQSVVTLLNEGVAGDDGELQTMDTVTSMTGAARLVGRAIREVERIDGPGLRAHDADFNVTMILGGQIAGRNLRMYMFYAPGNYIEASPETPFFQIGESKYGKPILDRVVNFDTTLNQGAKCALISMDSTIRSNISVGLPLDLLIYPRAAEKPVVQRQITADDPYYSMIRDGWSGGLRSVFRTLPDPIWPD